MPTINKKLLLRLIIITLVLGAGVFGLHYVQAGRTTEAVRWQAEHAAEQGKLNKAISFMKQYLELRPDDYDAATQLGDMILARGTGPRELNSALFLFDRILRMNQQRDDVRRKLLDICLRLNRNTDAMAYARALLEKSPRDSELWEKLGMAQAGDAKYDEARQSLEKAVEYDPSRIIPYERLVDLLNNQLSMKDQARELMDKMVKANPGAADAYRVRAAYFRREKKYDDCQREVGKLLEIDPENADGLLMSAEIMQQKGDIVRARSALADGVAMHVKDVRFYRSLWLLEMAASNIPAALACLEQGARELPNSSVLLIPLADLLIQQKELDRAQEIIKKLDAAPYLSGQVKFLRGRILMQQSKWADAVRMLEAVRTMEVANADVAVQANLLLAACHERLGNRDAQLETLRRAQLLDGGDLNVHLQLGAICLQTGDVDGAIKEYSAAANSPYAPLGVRITLGRLLIARARSASADEWRRVAEALDQIRKKYPNSVEPLLLVAQMHVARQEPEAARKLLRSEAGKYLNDARIWSVLASISLEEEGMRAAIADLDEAQALIGDHVELRLARARVWASDWQPGRDKRVFALAKKIDDFSEADQMRLLLGLADACSLNNDLEGVKQIQKQVAARLPRELPIRRALFDIATRTNDRSLAAQVRDEIRHIDESVAAVTEALAAIGTANPLPGAVSNAEAVAQKVLSASPNRADAHLLKAMLAEKAGDSATAAAEYARGVELEGTNLKQIEAQLAFLLRTGGDSAIKQRIEQLYNDPRLAGEDFLSVIAEATAGLSPDRLDKVMSMATPLFQTSGVSLLWAARLDDSRGRRAQALAHAKKAIAIAPRLVDAWAAQIRLAPDSGLETLKSAAGVLSVPAFFQLCAEAADDLRKANPGWQPTFPKPEHERLYAQECVNTALLRGKNDEAAKLLENAAKAPNAQPDFVAWAKRSQALLQVVSGSAEERRKALPALTASNSTANTKIEDLRAEVVSLSVAARLMSGPERKQAIQSAIRVLSLITASKEAAAKDWHQLAQYCKLAEERSAYLKNLKEAMDREPGNLFYAIAYVEELLRDDKLDEAAPYVEKLEQATNDARAPAVAAHYYILSNLPWKAQQVVDQFVQAADVGSQGATVRRRQAAGIYDQMARLAASKKLPFASALISTALDKYRHVVAGDPEAAAPTAALLAFDNRPQEALDLLGKHRLAMTSKALTSAALGVLRYGNSTPAQFQLVRAWLEDVARKAPNSVSVRMNFADLFALQRDYATAEKIYREVIKAEPDNVVALNNLAWMLSPQRNESDEAMKCVQRAIELIGPNGELLDTRARIWIARGDFNRAIDDLHEALQQARTSLRYFHLALAFFRQSKNAEALKQFKEARAHGLDEKNIHPSDMDIYRTLAHQMTD